MVLSIWQDGRCQATVRLARADVPEVTRALVAGLVPVPMPVDDRSRPGTVHQLHPGADPGTSAGPTDVLSAGPVTSLREVTDRIATTVIARVRKLTSGR